MKYSFFAFVSMLLLVGCGAPEKPTQKDVPISIQKESQKVGGQLSKEQIAEAYRTSHYEEPVENWPRFVSREHGFAAAYPNGKYGYQNVNDGCSYCFVRAETGPIASVHGERSDESNSSYQEFIAALNLGAESVVEHGPHLTSPYGKNLNWTIVEEFDFYGRNAVIYGSIEEGKSEWHSLSAKIFGNDWVHGIDFATGLNNGVENQGEKYATQEHLETIFFVF